MNIQAIVDDYLTELAELDDILLYDQDVIYDLAKAYGDNYDSDAVYQDCVCAALGLRHNHVEVVR